ncbi:hypothetical protein SLOPH_588 [Spraguea lophii 42_110]|uniref:Leucine rich repeat protein n=1 Tax=Spraguea lophii (strain 42_110) TaxID=1358809 RepID=S7W577_SPRLO|nr:hypothetical protein SLOPH_588 [Spraguea lophii 42_110]
MILRLNDNEFDIIPSGIINMINLEVLSIENCYNLTNISLNLSHNYLLFKNNNFIACPIYSNDKTSTEKENNDSTNLVFSESLKILWINNNSLSSFPINFLGFINLE